MLKAASGGGGKGIRVAESVKDLKDAYDSASAEAIANFGDGRLYMEKYIHNPRHIEVQILGDNYGMWCTCSSVSARCSATRS